MHFCTHACACMWVCSFIRVQLRTWCEQHSRTSSRLIQLYLLTQAVHIICTWYTHLCASPVITHPHACSIWYTYISKRDVLCVAHHYRSLCIHFPEDTNNRYPWNKKTHSGSSTDARIWKHNTTAYILNKKTKRSKHCHMAIVYTSFLTASLSNRARSSCCSFPSFLLSFFLLRKPVTYSLQIE